MAKKSPTAPKSAWTLLVYLAGDNNLTEEMAWSLQELKITAEHMAERLNGKNRATPLVNLVAHFDPRGARGRRFDFLPKSNKAAPQPPAAQDGNLDHYEALVYTPTVFEALTVDVGHDVADPAVRPPSPSVRLTAFVREQVKRLTPAREYFLVLSGHGSGAVGDFLTDSDPDTSLSIPELARILKEGRAYNATLNDQYEKGVDKDNQPIPKRIAILGMDSCLMSNAEVCFEVSDHAELLVASEGWVSNTGWPYHRVLEALVAPGATRPRSNPQKVAEQVAHNYSDFYRDYELSGVSTDVAVCNLEAFRKTGPRSLVGCLRHFSRECIPRLEEVYVDNLLSATKAQVRQAEDTLRELSRALSEDLQSDAKDRRDLATKLRHGSEEARRALGKNPWDDQLTPSQLEALRELLDSMENDYSLKDKTLAARLKEKGDQLNRKLDKPGSLANALAIVRVLREFDPGVQQALCLIEQHERRGNPKTKAARARLQKLHQVQWLLDLHSLAALVSSPQSTSVPNPKTTEDRRLRDALVAARWQAQSFKAGVYVDLFDLCRCLGERLTKKRERALCTSVQRAIDSDSGRAILLSHYTGPAFQHAHGLSVYFPVNARDYASEYENLEFAEQTGWGRLVRAYLRLTRRDRRDEGTHWAKANDQVLRFGDLEIDPLETDTIEARIIGVTGPPSDDDRFLATHVRAGTEKRIREGTEKRIREGTEKRIRAGTEKRIREGTEKRIRGEGAPAVWGNPPDGFFRATGGKI